MHRLTPEQWQHSHNFSIDNAHGERRTRYVLILTTVTMIVEIITGSLFGSMALLADGWHMGTHVAAFLLTIYAYRYARQHAQDAAFTFGTGKVGVLGGFASAIALAVVALVMLVESLQRLITPQAIQFNAAITVAVVGLLINIISAMLLNDEHEHSDDEHEHPDLHDHHHDHNLQAAYLHVLADALTSVLAIVALLSGKYFGWHWLDPVMGIVGAVIITHWSIGLMKQTSPILLDQSIDDSYQKAIKQTLEQDADNRIADIHIWKISAHHYAAIISLVTHVPKPTEHYKALLRDYDKLSHLTVEVYQCQDCDQKA